MNNSIGKVFDIFESEVKSVIKDIVNPVKDKSVKYYLNENLEFLFICVELPGVLKENCNIEFTSNSIKISFVTSYDITTSENISKEDFSFMKNKQISEVIDLSRFNIDESGVYANFINGLLKIKLKKKPKTNININ